MNLFKSHDGRCNLDIFKDCYPEIDANTSWETIQPKIKQAFIKFIWPCIGKKLTQKICEWAEKDPGTLTPLQLEILNILRLSTAHYVVFLLAPTLNVFVGDKGVNQAGSDGKTRPADRASYNEFKYSVCDCAYDYLEYLIFDLLGPAAASLLSDGLLDDLKESDLKTLAQKYCGSLLSRPADFNFYFPLADPGRFRHYLKLRPFINGIESKIIEQCLCLQFYCDLLKKACDLKPGEKLIAPPLPTPGDDESVAAAYTDFICQKLLDLLRRYIAGQTMKQANQKLNLQFTADGPKILDRLPGSRSTKAAGVAALNEWAALMQNCGDINLEQITTFLNSNKTFLPLYLDCLEAQNAEPTPCPPGCGCLDCAPKKSRCGGGCGCDDGGGCGCDNGQVLKGGDSFIMF